MAKKIPLRKCIATNELLAKHELIRVVKTPQQEVIVDTTGRANGRGAYLKKDITALEIAIKKDLLKRALGVDVDEAIYEELRGLITQ